MANLFEYEREAIRIKARRIDLEKDEYRKFSVDPNLTSFEVLQSILCRAFELPSSDISINYLHVDRGGNEVWCPLLSDWDLDTAILESTDYALHLQVRMLEVGSLGELANNENKGRIVSPILEVGQNMARKTLQEVAATAKAAPSQVSLAGAGLQGLMSKSSTQASGFFKRHYEQTLPGLASKMKNALNLELDEKPSDPVYPPVTDEEFRKFLNKVGQMVSAREFRLAVYRGGIEPSLRKIAWKHILNVYPSGMTGLERVRHLRELSQTYHELKSDWMDLVLQGRVTDDVKTVINMVRKDVLRTDRQHSFFAGEGNHNVTSLFNILTTYALNHPSVSYCQGMSDLASPLLVTMGEESHAYICFAALMSRLKPNFMLDGLAMTTKFQHLSEGLMYYDPEFYTYLKLHMADDLLFCYRWLLLEMKREFPFDMALKAMEVTWSSLPPATAHSEVELWETRFSPKMVASRSDVGKMSETPYGKVVAIRKQSVERQISDNSAEAKLAALREREAGGAGSGGPRGRIRSDTTDTDRRRAGFNKSQSASNVNLRRRGLARNDKGSLDDSGEAKQDVEADDEDEGGDGVKTRDIVPATGKRLTNLKDFYNLTDTNGKQQQQQQPSGTKSSLTSPPSSRLEKKKSPGKCENRDDSVTSGATPTKKAVVEVSVVSPCVEAEAVDTSVGVEANESSGDDPFDFVGYSQANSALTIFCNRLPPPTQFGHGNPFLMFLCLSCLLQHRDHIMRNQLDYQDIAMYFDRMVRGHDVDRVLSSARRIFAEYLNDDWSPSPQTTAGNPELPNC